MKNKSKINNFIKHHKLIANILGKSAISMIVLLIAYCIAVYLIAVYLIIFILNNIIVISILLLIVWSIWDKEIDLFDFLNKK